MGKSKQINKEILQRINKLTRRNAIMATITCSAPVAWLFIYIYQENLQNIFVAAICTVPALIWNTYLWSRYFHNKETEQLLLEICDLEEKIAELNEQLSCMKCYKQS